MMNELVTFMNARLDEDQAWAEGCQGHHWQWVCSDNDQVAVPEPAEEEYLIEDGARLSLRSVETKMSDPISRPNGLPPWPAQPLPISWPIYHAETIESTAAGHIVRHDPARVLRDIAADRKLIARYKAAVESHEEALQTLAAARKQWGGMSQETNDAYEDTITTSARAGAFLTVLEDRAARFSDHEDYQPHWRQP